MSSSLRMTKDRYFLDMAQLASMRGTCSRRSVGCVIVNSKGHVLATGYNGVAAGQPHCSTTPCPGAKCKSGEGLDLCQAIHAEQNALLQCRDVYEIDTVYCTDSPCVHCVKLLLNTSCKRIVYIREYPHSASADMWISAGRELVQEADIQSFE